MVVRHSIDMKFHWIWPLVLGLILGAGLGFALSLRPSRAEMPKGSTLLHEFSFATIAAKLGTTNWHVVEDKIYEPFPTLARAKRIARRIVARTEMSDGQLGLFATQFQQAVSAALVRYEALNAAQFDLIEDATRAIEGVPIRSRIDLPRRYYAIGDTHGVADVWYVAESGRVTLIASFIEGP